MSLNTNSSTVPVQRTVSRLQNEQQVERANEFLDEILQEQAARCQRLLQFPITEFNNELALKQEKVFENYRKMATDKRWLHGQNELKRFECPRLDRYVEKMLASTPWKILLPITLILLVGMFFSLQFSLEYWKTKTIQIEYHKMTVKETAGCTGIIIGGVCIGILVRYLILALVLRNKIQRIAFSIHINQENIPWMLNCTIEICSLVTVTLILWAALATRPYLLQKEKPGISLLKAMNIVLVTKLPIVFNWTLDMVMRYLSMEHLGIVSQRDEEAGPVIHEGETADRNEADGEGRGGEVGSADRNEADGEGRVAEVGSADRNEADGEGRGGEVGSADRNEADGEGGGGEGDDEA